MKKLGILSTFIALVAFTACKEKKTDNEEAVIEETVEEVVAKETKSLTILLESKSESTATGKVTFEEADGMVKMEATISGLTPGTHAIHIHEKADCSSPDGTSTGGHWNPTMAKHGKWGDSEGYHRGDIGNMVASDDGSATVSMQTDEWCIGCGDEKKDLIGKAIIVHAGVDDFKTQPTGDAGGRVSCGGIIQ
jgi:Cu-Zn family superoxide dismutase